jgi:hypothetical protein
VTGSTEFVRTLRAMAGSDLGPYRPARRSLGAQPLVSRRQPQRHPADQSSRRPPSVRGERDSPPLYQPTVQLEHKQHLSPQPRLPPGLRTLPHYPCREPHVRVDLRLPPSDDTEYGRGRQWTGALRRPHRAQAEVPVCMAILVISVVGGEVLSVSSSHSVLQIIVRVNYPPSSGNCTAQPTSGTALVTDFVLRCARWTDQEGHYPLTYTFSALRSSGARVVLSAAASTSPSLQVNS